MPENDVISRAKQDAKQGKAPSTQAGEFVREDGDDQALLAMHQRDLGDLLNGNECQVILGSGSDIDERAQAVVLAEIATRGFVTRGAVFDLSEHMEHRRTWSAGHPATSAETQPRRRWRRIRRGTRGR